MSKQILDFIFNYLTKDKTQNALMLTSPWGTGKSYFINNELSNFLKDKGIKCIIVSLYGLNNLQDLSKAIFIEAKCKAINSKNLALQSAKIIATTVAKGIASFWGINLDISEKQLEKLYRSLDFSKTLLVLEDLERSGIEAKEVLGFVNNLVEHDGAKVLLVANENELLKTGTKKVNDETKTFFTNKSEEYLSIKEKTVGDTIHFNYVNEKVLENIMSEFDSEIFKQIVINHPDIFSIILKDIMSSNEINCLNLRAFKYACQKTIDLFGSHFTEFDSDFIYDVFLGNVGFCLRKSKRDNLYWDNKDDDTSISLGTAKHPLFRIGYWYIQNQYHLKDLIDIQFQIYKNTKEHNYHDDKIKNNLDIIYDYYDSSEIELTSALSEISKEIENNNIAVNEYLKLGNYLVSIKENIPYYSNIVNELKTNLINSLRHRDDLPSSLMLLSGIELASKKAQDEYNEFSHSIKDSLSRNTAIFNFDYTTETLSRFEEYIFKQDGIINDGTFITKLDLDKFISFLQKCNARDMSTIRRIFRHVYNYSDINVYLHSDCDLLLQLKENVERLEHFDNQDKIVNLQLRWFIDDLNKYLKLLKCEVK